MFIPPPPPSRINSKLSLTLRAALLVGVSSLGLIASQPALAADLTLGADQTSTTGFRFLAGETLNLNTFTLTAPNVELAAGSIVLGTGTIKVQTGLAAASILIEGGTFLTPTFDIRAGGVAQTAGNGLVLSASTEIGQLITDANSRISLDGNTLTLTRNTTLFGTVDRGAGGGSLLVGRVGGTDNNSLTLGAGLTLGAVDIDIAGGSTLRGARGADGGAGTATAWTTTGTVNNNVGATSVISLGAGETLNVAALNNTGTLRFGISSSSSTTAAGTSGRIVATGNVTLNTGTVIQLVPIAGGYTQNAFYNLITSGGAAGVAGAGAPANQTATFGGVNVTLDTVDTNNDNTKDTVRATVTASTNTGGGGGNPPPGGGTPGGGTVIPTVLTGASGNQSAVLRVIQGFAGNTSEIGQLYGNAQLMNNTAGNQRALETLVNDNAVEAANSIVGLGGLFADGAFGRAAQVSGRGASIFGPGEGAGIQVASLATDGVDLAQMFGSNPALLGGRGVKAEYGAWGRAIGQIQDGRDRGALNATQYGLQVGVDRAFGDVWSAGVTAAYGHTDGGLQGRTGTDIDVDSYMLGAYGSYTQGPWLVTGLASYGYHDTEMTRQIQFGQINRRAQGDAGNQTFSLAGETSYAIDLGWEGAVLTPSAGLRYTALVQDGYTETGAGAFGLRVSEEWDNSFILSGGLALSKLFTLGDGGRFLPEARIGFEHEFGGNHDRSVNFIGAPAARFTVGETSDRGRTAGILGTGFAYGLPNTGMAIVADYQTRVTADEWSHRLMGGLRVNW